MTYAEKLHDPRWQKRRLEIFQRDDWKCHTIITVKQPEINRAVFGGAA